jgi:hypothetical protein
MHYGIWWDTICSLGDAVGILSGVMILARSLRPYVSTTRSMVLASALLIAFIGWYPWSALVLAVQKSGDLGHCQDFVDAAVQTNVVPQSVSAPGQPAVFCEIAEYGILRSRYQVVGIYSVPRDQQREVLTALTTAHQHVNGAPVQVLFYERENWQTWTSKDGRFTGGSRGPEKIQRVAVLR